MGFRGTFAGIIFTIAMGFFLGFILAGIGGISAGVQASQTELKLEITKIEEFWSRTDLSEQDLKKLVNDKACHLSEKYFLACVNSVVNALTLTQQRLGFGGDILPAYTDMSTLDNFKEKENLVPFSRIYKEGLHLSYSFERLWENILAKANNKTPAKYLIAQGINGFLSVNKDPHTYILPLEYFNQVSSSSERSPYFVGLSLDKEEGFIRVKKIIRNSDADLAGLQVNDIVLSINGKKSEDLSLTDAGQLLRDRNARIFSFTIRRQNETMIKKVQRSYRVLSQVYSDVIKGRKNIGLIGVSKFSKNTCTEVEKSIQQMANKNISGLVLDLRDNPGGLLSEAACLAGLFIGEGRRIYSVQYFDVSKTNEVALTSADKIYSGPLVVLVNSNSASASELLAGAMQEYRRAIVVGAKTFGKGTFQEIEKWNESDKVGFFKTKGFYLLPSGESTQFYGVTPDIEVIDPRVQISSEEISYMNPIKPEKLNVQTNRFSSPLPRCIGHKIQQTTDIVLSQAIDTLSCSELMSYVAMQFK